MGWLVSRKGILALRTPWMLAQLTQCPAEAALHRRGMFIDVIPIQTEACLQAQAISGC